MRKVAATAAIAAGVVDAAMAAVGEAISLPQQQRLTRHPRLCRFRGHFQARRRRAEVSALPPHPGKEAAAERT